MIATPAYAQAAGAAAGAGSGLSGLMQTAPFLLAFAALMYFMMIRPQQQAQKKHKEMIAGIKRGDTVVLNSGVHGKVVRVEDQELGVEIATGVTIKVSKHMIHDVRVKGQPAPANDIKS